MSIIYRTVIFQVLEFNMKSSVVALSPIIKRIRRIADTLHEDRVTVYAAQTAFYICISAIPFVILLILLIRLFSPDLVPELAEVLHDVLPREASGVLDFVFTEASQSADIPIVSTAAAAALWSASRGIRAVMRGVSEVYRVPMKGTFVYTLILSLIYTALFVAIITATVLFFVFGGIFPLVKTFDEYSSLFRFKYLLFAFFLTLYFSLLYFVVTKGVFFFKRERKTSECCPEKLRAQLPGALFSAAGWLLFSFFYSLYIRYFPRSSYVYGSLGAVVFLMLWLYFCMYIILLGAEINKMMYLRRKGEKRTGDARPYR